MLLTKINEIITLVSETQSINDTRVAVDQVESFELENNLVDTRKKLLDLQATLNTFSLSSVAVVTALLITIGILVFYNYKTQLHIQDMQQLLELAQELVK